MQIRKAVIHDRPKIIEIYKRSQEASQLPDPSLYPQEELGERLYAREAVERLVAVEDGRIVGHGMIEEPNAAHIDMWQKGLGRKVSVKLLELGGDFVEPEFSGRGIWTALLDYRLLLIRELGAVPVCATWSQNAHVKRTLLRRRATECGSADTPFGEVTLFVF